MLTTIKEKKILDYAKQHIDSPRAFWYCGGKPSRDKEAFACACLGCINRTVSWCTWEAFCNKYKLEPEGRLNNRLDNLKALKLI